MKLIAAGTSNHNKAAAPGLLERHPKVSAPKSLSQEERIHRG
jgi:hypothetical protein